MYTHIQIIHYLPSLRNCVYKAVDSYIYELFLQLDYKFINICNNVNDTLARSSFLKFNKFLLKSFSWHWIRIAFRGKGFRMRKFKRCNKLTLSFGHSHWAKTGFDNQWFFIRKIRRQNYMCVVKGYHVFKGAKHQLKFIKRLNMYTKRGLRLRKQFILRRFGKISQVVSSLH